MHGVFQGPIPWNRSLASLIFRLIAGERMSARQTVVTCSAIAVSAWEWQRSQAGLRLDCEQIEFSGRNYYGLVFILRVSTWWKLWGFPESVPSPVEFMYKKWGINKRAQNAGPNLLVALASLREACNPKIWWHANQDPSRKSLTASAHPIPL